MVEMYPNYIFNILIGFFLLHFGIRKSRFHYLSAPKLSHFRSSYASCAPLGARIAAWSCSLFAEAIRHCVVETGYAEGLNGSVAGMVEAGGV